MDRPIGQIEFVNRTEELDHLQFWASPELSPPSLVFIRARSGIGKSSLTDRLLESIDRKKTLGVVVDPDIRARAIGGQRQSKSPDSKRLRSTSLSMVLKTTLKATLNRRRSLTTTRNL